MLRECTSEIAKIRACHSCYKATFLWERHSFCKPCRPPHPLVFVGPNHMPAKVGIFLYNSIDNVINQTQYNFS